VPRPGAGERFVLVGGGAGGVELALAARKALPEGVDLILLTDDLLPGQNGARAAGSARALSRPASGSSAASG
jgi:hypothetical protein